MSSLSFALFWSCRCWPFVVILEEIALVVLHIPVFLSFCKKSIRSCLPPRNPPCCAFFPFVLSWAWAALSPTGKLPGIPPPLRDRRWGCGMGTLTPAPRSRWLCVRVAPYRGVPRLTSLVAGTTSSPVVRIRIAVGICYQGPRCPTRHPPRGSLPASCQLLFYCFLALAPAQLSPA